MADFIERLLSIMDQKNHWGWEQIIGPKLKKNQLLPHFQQEYEVYVRDFPILLARVLGKMPADRKDLVREFAENIYEEQTGGISKEISKGISHPELFLKMMRGLGFKEKEHFSKIELLPTSVGYRSFIDYVTFNEDWRVGAALLTLFIEGSVEDRARMQKNYKNTQSLDQKLKSHSLFKFHGLKVSDMDLVRVHYAVEGGHRKSAWETLLKEMKGAEIEEKVVDCLQKGLELWQLYRDGICIEMGLENPNFKALSGG